LTSISRNLARVWRWLTLDGRLSAAQPWALLLGPLALILALIAPYRGLFIIAYTYILLVLALYLWIREVGPRVQVRRRLLSEWAQVGDELEEQWELANDARLPLLWLALEDDSTLPGYTGRRVAAAAAGSQQQWLTSARCERRGVYTLGPLQVSLGDPLGLFQYAWNQGGARKIVIYPALVRLPPLIVPQGQRGGLARADLLQQHVTPSVGGLREYVRGDPPSRIHWPTVARTDRLMVKEFDQERAGSFWIALDLAATAYREDPQAVRNGDRAPVAQRPEDIYTQSSLISVSETVSRPATPLELAIVLACSLASQALSEGRAVGLLTDDGQRRLVTPGRGPRQLWRILGALVDASATGALPFGEVLRQGQAARAGEGAGTALAVVTPSLGGEWLPALASWRQGRAGGTLALLVTRRPALAQPLATRLAASGVATHTFEVGAPLPLLNPAKRKITERVSPLGKVMRVG
jgi:uncharacterized protein (DUF58 family)